MVISIAILIYLKKKTGVLDNIKCFSKPTKEKEGGKNGIDKNVNGD